MLVAFPPRRPLCLALAALFLQPLAALAQQVVADGDDQAPAAGDYSTSAPVEPGNPAGYVFHAINGGSIVPIGAVNLRSTGMRASAARIEGAGSRLALEGGSITTTGYGAAGVSLANGGTAVLTGTRIETEGQASFGIGVEGGTLQASNIHVVTRGGLGHGLHVQGGDVQLRDSVIETHDRASALVVGAGDVVAERVRLEQATSGAAVVIQPGGAATVTLRDTQINGTAAGAAGISGGLGSTLHMERVHILLDHAQAGSGLTVAGDVVFNGGRIRTQGSDASAIIFSATAPGSVLLDSVQMEAAWGITLGQGSQLHMVASELITEKGGISLGFRDGTARLQQSSIQVRNGNGVSVSAGSSIDVQGSLIGAGGDNNFAVAVYDGTATLADTGLRTTGASGHALYTFGNGTSRPTIVATRSEVVTEGDRAYGAAAYDGGSVHLIDSLVQTQGQNAHGVVARGSGEVTLSGTDVLTQDEGAWAAVIDDGGSLGIDGSRLVSRQHGGVWVRDSRDAGLTLSEGSFLHAGNGMAIALDASVSGRFDVVLQGGSQMMGDIVTAPHEDGVGLLPQSEVHLRLAEGSRWQGTSDRVLSMAIDTGSQWTLTADTTVGALQVNDSGVALSDGSGRFNTLTVDGNLHSERATFLFQGRLGGDGSAIDRLHVRGDASGDASIVVRNIGGRGAATVDGIRLIEVEGASQAKYALAGRAVAGSHEYFLFQGGMQDPADGNWYLRSQWFDVCERDPVAPGCVVDPGPGPGPDPGEGGDEGGGGDPVLPPPVLRPEGGAYLANLTAAQQMFALGYHARQAGQNGGRGWARVDGSRTGFDAVSRQLDVRGSSQALSVGADLLRGEGGSAFGVLLSTGNASSTSTNALTGYYARGKVKGEALGVYGTWRAPQADPYAGWYVDGSLQRAQFRNRVEGVALTPERYDSKAWQGALETGYALRLGGDANGGLYLEPQLQVGYNRWDSLRHTEANGTVVTTRDADGVFGRAGVRLSGVTHWGAGQVPVQPYIAAHWLHQRSASAVLMDDERVDARIPRSRGEFSAGASLKFAGGLGAWGGLSLQRASGYHQTSAQVGLSYSW